jgi:hypothetical protein
VYGNIAFGNATKKLGSDEAIFVVVWKNIFETIQEEASNRFGHSFNISSILLSNM